jgi:hypothetical protein
MMRVMRRTMMNPRIWVFSHGPPESLVDLRLACGPMPVWWRLDASNTLKTLQKHGDPRKDWEMLVNGGIKPTHASWANKDMIVPTTAVQAFKNVYLDQPVGGWWTSSWWWPQQENSSFSENVQFIIVLESDLQFVCIFLVIWTYPNSTHFAHPHLSQPMPHHRYPQGYNRLPPPSCPSNLPPPTNILLDGSSQES